MGFEIKDRAKNGMFQESISPVSKTIVFETPEALAPIWDRLPLLRTFTELLRRRQAVCDNLRRGVRIHTGESVWLTAACFVFQRRW